MMVIMKWTEVYPDIYRITLPLPGSKPGPVNVYLFKGENITLMDTGTKQTVPLLLKAAYELGFKPSDIKNIVFTHGHIDHCGGAKYLQDYSRNRIIIQAHADDISMIEKGYDVKRKYIDWFLKQMGLPFKYRIVMFILFRYMSLMGNPCHVEKTIRDNDYIKLGNYTAQVIHTPGHSKGSLCFYIEKENILFSGDSLLPHITPNAFVMLDSCNRLPVRSSQKEFSDSINKITALKPFIVFPAHGETIRDVESITKMYKDSYQRLDRIILNHLEIKNYTVYELAVLIFKSQLGRGRHFLLQIYLAISEIYTHLQVLEKNNRIQIVHRRNVLSVVKVHEH